MAKIKEILCNPITWIVVCFVVLVVAVIGVVVSYVSVTIAVGDYSDKFSLTLANMLSSKNVDYNVFFTCTYSYTIGTGSNAVVVSGSDVSSIAASYSDWSQFSNIGYYCAFAFVTVGLAVLALIIHVVNKFVKNETINEVLNVANTVVCFALLLFGILALIGAAMFMSNINDIMINSSVQASVQGEYEALRDAWFTNQLGMTYAEAEASSAYSAVSSSCTTATASIGVLAGPVLLFLAGLIGGIFNIVVCSSKIYKLIK